MYVKASWTNIAGAQNWFWLVWFLMGGKKFQRLKKIKSTLDRWQGKRMALKLNWRRDVSKAD